MSGRGAPRALSSLVPPSLRFPRGLGSFPGPRGRPWTCMNFCDGTSAQGESERPIQGAPRAGPDFTRSHTCGQGHRARGNVLEGCAGLRDRRRGRLFTLACFSLCGSSRVQRAGLGARARLHPTGPGASSPRRLLPWLLLACGLRGRSPDGRPARPRTPPPPSGHEPPVTQRTNTLAGWVMRAAPQLWSVRRAAERCVRRNPGKPAVHLRTPGAVLIPRGEFITRGSTCQNYLFNFGAKSHSGRGGRVHQGSARLAWPWR